MSNDGSTPDRIKLPGVADDGSLSIEEAIRQRRSIERLASDALSLDMLARLCWAGQGITEKHGQMRAAPSARSVYPITLFTLEARGLYEYRPKSHTLSLKQGGDLRSLAAGISDDLARLSKAPLAIVVSIDTRRMDLEFGDWADRLSYLEAGAIVENILLEATSLGLAAYPLGAFDPDHLAEALPLGKRQRPALVIICGRRAA